MGLPTSIQGHVSDEGTVPDADSHRNYIASLNNLTPVPEGTDPLRNSKRSHQCIAKIRRNEVKPRPLNEVQADQSESTKTLTKERNQPINVRPQIILLLPDEGRKSS